MPRVVKGSSAVGLTGMSMLRSAEGNGRQAREPNMASKAPAQPAAQNACAANPAAAAAAAPPPPEAAAPETMDVDGVHANTSLHASPSLHAVSMPAFAPCMEVWHGSTLCSLAPASECGGWAAI